MNSSTYTEAFAVANFSFSFGMTTLINIGNREPQWPRRRGEAFIEMREQEGRNREFKMMGKMALILSGVIHPLAAYFSSEKDWGKNARVEFFLGSATLLTSILLHLPSLCTQKRDVTFRNLAIKLGFVAAFQFGIGMLCLGYDTYLKSSS